MKRLIHYIPTVAVASCIAYLSLIRETGFSLPHFTGWDKLAHFCMYFTLAAVMRWDTLRDRQQGRMVSIVLLVVCCLYGGLIEILQERYFYPRTGDWLDWLADCLGTVFGLYSLSLVWKHRKKDAIC